LFSGGAIVISLIDLDLGGRGEYIATAFCFPLFEDPAVFGKEYGTSECIGDVLLIRSLWSVGEVGRLSRKSETGGNTGSEKSDAARVRPLKLFEASEAVVVLPLARLGGLTMLCAYETMIGTEGEDNK
jgi:hypothetical protein